LQINSVQRSATLISLSHVATLLSRYII